MLSLIIPTIDEDDFATSVAHFHGILPSAELIRVDSSDVKPNEIKGVTLLHVRRQERAYQMNIGARTASGDIFLFLHADTILPVNVTDVVAEFSDSQADYTAFSKKFDHSHWLLEIIARVNNWQLKRFQIFLGDNGLLITRDAFEKSGCWPAVPLMEDILYSKLLKSNGSTFQYAESIATTSARKFLKGGVLKIFLLMQWLRIQHLFGVSEAKIKSQYYGKSTCELVLYAKYPEPGKVKTRLAVDTGDEKAVELYTGWVRAQIAAHTDQRYHLSYSLGHAEDEERFAKLFNVSIDSIAIQKGVDLGDRMFTTIKNKIKEGEVCLIAGTDVPSLTTDIVDQACSELESHDVVIGPSVDGGYYLIGMKAPHKKVFENIKWSTETVLDKTIKNCISAKLSYALLPTLRDIDTIDDLKAEGIKKK